MKMSSIFSTSNLFWKEFDNFQNEKSQKQVW